MTIAEQIYTLVKTLPQDEANEILTFAEYIRRKHETGLQPTDPEEPEVPWAEFDRSLAGAWADDFPNLETIRAGMGHDVLRESL
jgi:hypothetical protein